MAAKIWTSKPVAGVRTIGPPSAWPKDPFARGASSSADAWPSGVRCQLAPGKGTKLADCLHGAGCLVVSQTVRGLIEEFYAEKRAQPGTLATYDYLHIEFLPVLIVDGPAIVAQDYFVVRGRANVNVLDLDRSKLVWRGGRVRGKLEKVERLAVLSSNVRGIEHGEFLPITLLLVDAEIRKRFAEKKVTGIAYQDPAAYTLDVEGDAAAAKAAGKAQAKRDAEMIAKAKRVGAAHGADISPQERADFAGNEGELADEAWWHGGAQSFEGDGEPFREVEEAFKIAFLAALKKAGKPKARR